MKEGKNNTLRTNDDFKQWLSTLKREIKQAQLKAAVREYIRQWYVFYNKENIIGQQAVAQLEDVFFSVP